jgi:two-component system phosphate regulon sensor histidine kinase PhoR
MLAMRDWIVRLAFHGLAAFAGAVMVGILGGWGEVRGWVMASVFLLAYLLVALGLQLRERQRLADWAAKPSAEDVPDVGGPWGDIYARLYRLLREQSRSRAGLSHALWRFRHAGEAMPDGVLVLDADNRIEWMNPVAEEHFGLGLKRDRQQTITNLVRHPAFVAYLESPTYAEPLSLRGDSDRILSIQLVPYGDNEKMILSRDVTRWERLESVRRDFIANVSHELRTPLTVMKGFLETLTDTERTDEKVYRRSLELMTGQAERMQRLVEDLLMLSRLEDSRSLLREEPLDAPALVAAVVQEAQSLSRGQHHFSTNLESVWLLASREEIRSAFSNLVTNAVRYTPPGGDIVVTWTLEDAGPVLRVRDNGEGIAPEHIPRLTERFYRVDRGRSRASGGTGLGLAIVKHVMQRHQGRLAIESEVGAGSTFSCHFPTARALPARSESAEVTPIRAA